MDDENNQSIMIEGAEPIDIIEMQQIFYQLFGFGSHLIYDCYTSKVFVEKKIEILCPRLDESNKNRLIDMIWMQRSHRGNNQLLMSPIFICIVCDSNIKDNQLTYPLNIKSKRYTVHPVFRIQKCSGITSVDENGQNKCCAIFVDEFGRVYQNWNDFRRNCKYADGLMVAPKLGIYNGSSKTNQVLLDIMQRSNGVTTIFDNGSTAVGLVSAVVTGVALIPTVTVAPVVLAVAIGAGITSAVYTGARSVFRLIDRKKHKQSIGLADNEARNAWLNVGVGVVSVGAAGATQVVSQAARSGRNISTLARNSVRVVNIAAVTVNASACADQSYSFVYTLVKHKTFSKQHAAQLMIDLFLLKHSWNNFHQVKQILANTSQNESITINEILIESQTESYANLLGHTRRICGDAAAPLVRSLKQTLCDPVVIIRSVQNAEGTIEDGFKAVWATMATPIAREYCRDFDRHLNQMIQMLERKLKVGKLTTIARPLINLLKDVTFKACSKFLNFLAEFAIEMAQSFERYLKMYHIELKQRSAIEHTDLNEYILSKRDDELRAALNEEKENVEKLQQIDEIYDETYGSDDDACDLEESRKLELLIDEYATEHTEEFEKYSPAVNTNELYEIIVQILQKLPYEKAKIFFTLAQQLISKYDNEIQKSLGRFISVDIFIVDIYCLLTDLSCRNNCESLSEYLTKYDGMEIEDQFIQFYTIKNDPSLKMACCSSCKGNVFVNK